MDEKLHKNLPLIGIDIGGTGIKGGIVDLKNGTLLCAPFRVPTPQPATPESVAEAVALVVAELSARPEAPAAGSPVGVTFPGIIQHGVVHSAANVDKSWLNTDIGALLTARLGRPVEVINDADAAGLAEAAAAQTIEADGGLDVLVNNAGIEGRARNGGVAGAAEVTADMMRTLFETNVFGVVRVIHAFRPLLQRSTAPVVVNLSSGLPPLPGSPRRARRHMLTQGSPIRRRRPRST
ncbi:NAD(P)-dependent dehydrogenase (short-subunit alcohol dehydrogenase family) [Arthrobacter sp. V4I6]|uniref:ROK family protein n=1 Tax=unclassified Arthrobacter TaxID=235627 RepID=UPI00277E6E2A|nr:NAD(P)-dependent dehydrogenase (short-subunit alcohol dehydrogenase family) [Arthrobacter sp. V1I7]MDQ0852939.1 NAD(P)-dependent dehydrogenase (short-subunit alcohol dehydrogenase family) [Arthrobacter sp. V4I6]